MLFVYLNLKATNKENPYSIHTNKTSYIIPKIIKKCTYPSMHALLTILYLPAYPPHCLWTWSHHSQLEVSFEMKDGWKICMSSNFFFFVQNRLVCLTHTILICGWCWCSKKYVHKMYTTHTLRSRYYVLRLFELLERIFFAIDNTKQIDITYL